MIVHVSDIIMYSRIRMFLSSVYNFVSIFANLGSSLSLTLQEYFSGTLQNSLYNILTMSAPLTSFQIRDHLDNYFYFAVLSMIQLHLSINLPICLIKNAQLDQ